MFVIACIQNMDIYFKSLYIRIYTYMDVLAMFAKCPKWVQKLIR